MILIDTGPLVALFNPKDKMHARCTSILKKIKNPLFSTLAVLTETFHLLHPGSLATYNLGKFIQHGGITIWPMDNTALQRAFELMEKYADQGMDLADASIITALEKLHGTTVFTLDNNDFSTYRIKVGYRHLAVKIIC